MGYDVISFGMKSSCLNLEEGKTAKEIFLVF